MKPSLASANTYRFSSKVFHEKSGLYYYGYRWYDPNLQRWPNRDPLAAQMPQKGQLWGYKLHIEVEQGPNLNWPFHNDPISNHDSDGQFVGILVCAIVAGVVVCGCSKAPPPPPKWPPKITLPPGANAACQELLRSAIADMTSCNIPGDPCDTMVDVCECMTPKESPGRDVAVLKCAQKLTDAYAKACP